VATTLYHFGRLLTYALAGLIAGAAGQLVDLGGEALGVQLVAARIVGTLMIVIGGVRLYQLVLQRKQFRQVESTPQASLITRTLVRLRPLIFRLPTAARGLVTGLLTPLLPCGWLYLFALVAAGTGSILTGPIVMIAFWLGTVPALVALVAGTQFLSVRFRKAIPVGAAVLLVLAGGYTVVGRGFAGLTSLADIRPHAQTPQAGASIVASPNAPAGTTAAANLASEQTASQLAAGIDELVKTPLPCCVDKPHGGDQAP
jgi:sulfite exporter TauE/SafE